MTFSDKRIVEYVTKHFVPVWESVAPVSTATFELGDGRVIKGTVGGEIAVFFCLPDGRTYDILPALQSPNVTYKAIVDARATFDRVKGDPQNLIRMHHQSDYEGYVVLSSYGGNLPPSSRPKSKRDLERRLANKDGGTRALSMMEGSKSGMMIGPEPMVVVEPGGMAYYGNRIHQLLSSGPPRTPLELRKAVFEDILEMKLEGRHQVFTPDSQPEPFMFTEDEE